MKPELHPRQKAILKILKRRKEGLSLRDIAKEIGANSPNTALHHIKQLEKKGYLRRNLSNPSDYTILKEPIENIVYVNLYGAAQCGPSGLLSDENVIDKVPFSTKAFGVSDQAFLVKARGDSMEPFILEHDLVLVAKQSVIENGEIALVTHNNKPKIKKVTKVGGKHVLESLNPKYPLEIIKTEDDFQIIGKLKNIIRFTNTKKGKRQGLSTFRAE